MADLMWARDEERSLLGALLVAPKRITEVGGLLPDHFDPAPGHAALFTAIIRTADDGGIDHIAVLQELTRVGALPAVRGGAGYLHELIETRGVGELGWLASQIGRAAARRAVALAARRIAQVIETQPDWERAMEIVATEALTLEASTDDPLEAGPVPGLAPLGEFVDRPRRALPWVIPGTLRRQERVIVIARPGTGKSMLARQAVTCVAAGRHAFQPQLRVPPQRSLLVDLENPDDIIADKTRPMLDRARRLGLYEEDGAWIWHRPEGIDIRSLAGFREFDRVVEQVRPALIGVGPLYKLTTKAGDDWETVAEQTARALDRVRVRHDCALWIEHHMPKGADSRTPFGSSLWERWPEFGFELAAPGEDDGPVYPLVPYRPGRDERSWPLGLMRDSDWPWVASWDPGTDRQVRALLAQQTDTEGDAA